MIMLEGVSKSYGGGVTYAIHDAEQTVAAAQILLRQSNLPY
jgi:hypothetical protein